MMLAFIWWAVLLQRYNFENTQLKLELTEYAIKHSMPSKHGDATYIQERYKSKTFQILGEAAVFGLTLIAGLFFLYRASRKEIQSAQKERNFLMSITHELKSPLTSINLILETFKKRNLPTDTIKELSSDALMESDRLDKLFDKVLTATKLGGDYQYYFEEQSLSKMVADVTHKFSRRNVKVNITEHIQDDIVYKYDSSAMQSILNNLLENAVKYSTKDNQNIDIKLSQSQEDIVLSIADNGIGIPDGEKKKVLEQFYRVGSEDTRKAKGTGLGLYIVNKMVNAHKGKLRIKDNRPQGTIFEITFKINK